MQTTRNIHVKCVLNNEFRRFSLDEEPTFGQLVELVRSTYSLTSTEKLKLFFIDDEKDLVVLSNDEELLYAVSIVFPLRVVVTTLSVEEEQKNTTISVTLKNDAVVENRDFNPLSDKTTCERGRGKQEWQNRKNNRNTAERITKEDRINFKISKITETIEQIESLLLTDLSANRARTLTWKLEKLKSKLSDFENLKVQLKEKVDEPKTEFVTPCGSRGHGGCGGRGRAPRAFENSELTKNNRDRTNNDQIWEKIRQCRQDLKAARKSGNQQEIEKCQNDLEEAKSQKWELKRERKEERNQPCPQKFKFSEGQKFEEGKMPKRRVVKQ